MNQEYNFEDDALYRYTPIDGYTAKRELVITKDEFLACYMKRMTCVLIVRQKVRNKQMKEEIQRLINQIEISQEINKRANELIKNNSYSDFTCVQLRMIANLSAENSLESCRRARKKLWEKERNLTECKMIFDERKQPVYEDKQEEEKAESEE